MISALELDTFGTLSRRFWAKVNRTESCWLWTGCSLPGGYGQIRVGGRNGQTLLAHRVAYELVNGTPPPLGLDHPSTCPKSCVNPAHLRLGNQKLNMENRGPSRNSKSGIRGVVFAANRWRAVVTHNGKQYHGGRYDTIEEAEKAAIALRNQLFTFNDVDRHDPERNKT